MILKQHEAAKLIGVTPETLRNYEKRGILKRYDTPRPGAWYDSRDLAPFLPVELRNAQHATIGRQEAPEIKESRPC
jgi:hypothetical protein